MGTVATTGDDDSVTFSIQSGNTGTAFAINGSTGQITLNDTTQLDASATPSYTLSIRATDGTTNSDQNVTINVTDDVAPTVTAIDRQTPANSLTNADSLTWRVTFSEAVANVDTADFSVSGTSGTVTNVASAGGNAYDVTVSGGDLASYTGAVTLSFAGGQDIADTAGTPNALTNTTPTGTNNPSYTLDNSAPTFNAAGSAPADDGTVTDLAANLSLKFSENIALGTGNIVLKDLTNNSTVETFNAVTGTGDAGGSISVATDTLTVNPNANLTGGTNYAIQIAATAITDTAGNAFAGIADDTTYNFTSAPLVELSVDNTTIAEAGGVATYTLSLKDSAGNAYNAPGDVTVTLSFSGSANGGGTDYSTGGNISGNNVTISNGASSQTFTVTGVNDDPTSDDNETVIVDIASVSNGFESGTQQQTVTLVENAAPVVSLYDDADPNDPSLVINEGASATLLDAAAGLSDADGDADWNGGTLTIQISNNAEAGDRISIDDQNTDQADDSPQVTITTSGTDLLANGTSIGTLSAADGVVTGSDTLTITFNANATNTSVREVLQSVRLSHTGDTPGTNIRTLTATATDKNSNQSSDARNFKIQSVNDPSVITLAQTTLNYTDVESDSWISISPGATFSDADGGVVAGANLIVAADGNHPTKADDQETGGSNGRALDLLQINTDGTGFTMSTGLEGGALVNTLLLNGSYLANLASGDGLAPLHVKFTNGATNAEVQQVLQAIQWRNIANNPESTRTFEYIMRDSNEEFGGNNLVINVSNANEAPRHRTDTLITEIGATPVREQFFNTDDWHWDRGPGTFFGDASFDGDTRIKVTTTDSGASRQGYVYDVKDATEVSVEMYVPSSWNVNGDAKGTLWINAFADNGERINAYPIMQVVEEAGAANPTMMQFWNGSGWETHNFPADVQLDSWMTLSMSVNNGDISFSLTGKRTGGEDFTLSGSNNGTSVTALWEVALVGGIAGHTDTTLTHAGESYDLYFDNLTYNTGSSSSSTWKSLSVGAGNSINITGLEVTDTDPGDTLTSVLSTAAGTLASSTGSGANVTGSGSGTLSLSGTEAQVNAALAGLSFTASHAASGNQAISITTTDAGTLSDTDTIALTIAAAPQIANLDGDSASATIGATLALDKDGDAAVTDTDSANFDGGYLLIDSGAGNSGILNLDGTNATAGGDGTIAASEAMAVGGTEIGIVDNTLDGQGGNDLKIALNSSATPARVAELLQNLSYTTSSAGSHTFAIQLSDAAVDQTPAFSATASVTLNFNTPPAPAPEPEPEPIPVPDDNDGIATEVEEQVPPLPTPDGTTVPGDGNGDGTPDTEQSDVTSVPFLFTPTAVSNPGDAPPVFVTLVAGSQNGSSSTDGEPPQLTSIKQLDAPGDRPGGIDMPLGLISFTANTNNAGVREDFSVFIDGDIPINGYWKQTPGGGWANLASHIERVGDKLRIDFSITDGGPFDADGQANGVITDPGAFGFGARPSFTLTDKIIGLYIAYYDRAPDQAGLQYWQERAEAGDSLYDISAGFAAHPRFSQEYDGLSPAQIAAKLYQNVLHRAGEPSGIAYWSGQLEQRPLSEVMVDFVSDALTVDLDAMLGNAIITADEYSVAFQRQKTIEHLLQTSQDFIDLFGAATVPQAAPEQLDTDPAYKAAIAVLTSIDHNLASVTEQQAQLLNLVGQPDPMMEILVMG